MKLTITKKRDGLMVSNGPMIIAFMNFGEGLVYRATGHIPDWIRRAADWYDPEAENTMPVHLNLRDKS